MQFNTGINDSLNPQLKTCKIKNELINYLNKQFFSICYILIKQINLIVLSIDDKERWRESP